MGCQGWSWLQTPLDTRNGTTCAPACPPLGPLADRLRPINVRPVVQDHPPPEGFPNPSYRNVKVFLAMWDIPPNGGPTAFVPRTHRLPGCFVQGSQPGPWLLRRGYRSHDPRANAEHGDPDRPMAVHTGEWATTPDALPLVRPKPNPAMPGHHHSGVDLKSDTR